MSNKFTVGDLRNQLKAYPDDFEIAFSGDLTFYRVKTRGEKLAVVEFDEFEAELTPSFREENPSIKVVFCEIDDSDTKVGFVSVPQL